MSLKTGLVSALVLAVVAVPVALRLTRNADAKLVEVQKAESRDIRPAVLASGTLVYGSQVTLVSELLARVDAVLVAEGDEVQKGKVLLRLDGESARAEVEQLSAGRAQAELNINRQMLNLNAVVARLVRHEELRKLGMLEATKYDDLVLQRDLAEVELRNSQKALTLVDAQLSQARQRLAKTEIRAPIDGRVMQVSIKRGEIAVPSAMSIAGGNLMVIADTRQVFAEVNVDETDIGKIAEGQMAQVTPVAFSERPLQGRVEQVALTPRQLPGQSRSYAVRIKLSETDRSAFRAGISARAEIYSDVKAGARPGVPVQAVQYAETGRKGEAPRASVFVLKDGVSQRRQVQTGAADDSHIEILRGLEVGEMVVVGPAKTLRFMREGDALKSAPTGSEAGDKGTARASVSRGGGPK